MDDEAVARTLALRAQQLARPLGEHGIPTTPMLVLVAGGSRLGVPLAVVDGVHRNVPISPVPWLPAPWIGLANVRGAVVPLLDLAVAVDVAAPGASIIDRVALVRGVGLGVETVSGVADSARHREEGFEVLDVLELIGDPRFVVEDALT
jgi:chemotaxis signal transduction protein